MEPLCFFFTFLDGKADHVSEKKIMKIINTIWDSWPSTSSTPISPCGHNVRIELIVKNLRSASSPSSNRCLDLANLPPPPPPPAHYRFDNHTCGA